MICVCVCVYICAYNFKTIEDCVDDMFTNLKVLYKHTIYISLQVTKFINISNTFSS
jgi:hypothetical protein